MRRWKPRSSMRFRRGDGLAIRAEVGWLSLPRVSRRRQDRTAIEIGPAAGAVLSRGRRGSAIALGAKQFVLDGEIVIPINGRLSFDELLLRIHPAESRVRKLAAEHPALVHRVRSAGRRARQDRSSKHPLEERRSGWRNSPAVLSAKSAESDLSPATTEVWHRPKSGSSRPAATSTAWSPSERTCRIAPGNRDGMEKIKQHRTADCVVGGFRYAERPQGRSARCCWACTTTKGCSITSASRRASRGRAARKSPTSSSR